jgi:hypothetical protein
VNDHTDVRRRRENSRRRSRRKKRKRRTKEEEEEEEAEEDEEKEEIQHSTSVKFFFSTTPMPGSAHRPPWGMASRTSGGQGKRLVPTYTRGRVYPHRGPHFCAACSA